MASSIRTASVVVRRCSRPASIQALRGPGPVADAATIGELIRYEVERPAIIRRHRLRHRRPGPDRPLAAATATNREPPFPVEPEQFLVVDQIASCPGPRWGQNELQTGFRQGGKVTEHFSVNGR
jgi:hypothetical protein